MTVAELIEKLKAMPPDRRVYVIADHFGNYPDTVKISEEDGDVLIL